MSKLNLRQVEKLAAHRLAKRERSRAEPVIIIPPAERLAPELQAEQSLASIEASAITFRVPVSQLNIPPYHGERNPYTHPAHATALKGMIRDSGGFHSNQCEVLTVSKRKDGSMWVIDGIGRLFMADQLSGGIVTHLECRVLTGLTYAQEVELFRRLGKFRRKITPFDAWLSQLGLPGHPDVKAIRTVVSGISKKNMPKVTLDTLQFGFAMKYPSGESVLADALFLVANTSLGLNHKFSNTMVRAVVAILGRNKKLDQKRFRDSIGVGDDLFSTRLFDEALTFANSLGYKKPHARTLAWFVARIITKSFYNYRFQGAHLDEAALNFVSEFPDTYSAAPPKPTKGKAKLKVAA